MAKPLDAMAALLHEPTNVNRVMRALLDLVDVSYVELFVISNNNATLPLSHETTERTDHNPHYGVQLANQDDVFRGVVFNREALTFAESGCSSIVAPVELNDKIFGVLYAHRVDLTPFSDVDIALCTGVGTLVAVGLHVYKERWNSIESGMRSMYVEPLVPPKFLARADAGTLKTVRTDRFRDIYYRYAGKDAPPESTGLQAATTQALALSPIERVALAGRLLDSAIDADLSGIDR